MTITTPGAVVSGVFLDGCIVVAAVHVTIRASRVDCAQNRPVIDIGPNASATVLEDLDVDGGGVAPVGVEGNDYAAYRLDVSGSADGAHLGGHSVFADSYVHDLGHQPGFHHDDLQTPQGSTGSDIKVLHNTLLDVSPLFNGNSAYHLGSGAISDVLVSGNYMDGGSFTVQVDNGPQQARIAVVANDFGRDYRFGLISATTSPGDAVTFSGNRWLDDGLAATEADARGAGRG